VLQEVVYYAHTGRTGDTDFLKYYIVILFPQLPAEAIESCTQCAPLVGSLTDGNELDDLVRQTVLAYLNVRRLPPIFLIPYHSVVCAARGKPSIFDNTFQGNLGTVIAKQIYVTGQIQKQPRM